jgi:hypothetical protein
MQSALRNLFVITVMALLAAMPLFGQNVHRLPEGGSELAYASLVGASCLGAIWYRVRRK